MSGRREQSAPCGSCRGWSCRGGSVCCVFLARPSSLRVPYPQSTPGKLGGTKAPSWVPEQSRSFPWVVSVSKDQHWDLESWRMRMSKGGTRKQTTLEELLLVLLTHGSLWGPGPCFRKVCVTIFSFLGAAQRTRALICSWVCQSFDTVPSKKPLNLLALLASSGSLPASLLEGGWKAQTWAEGALTSVVMALQ